jgi:hypothetical protein
MAIPLHLWLKDDGGADIRGSSEVVGREGSIEVLSLTHGIHTPTGSGRDNPRATATRNVGPLPAGTYYLVDRQSGGMMGWLRDWYLSFEVGSSDRTKWFMLWNPHGGDTTMINGIQRGNFRLHPEGSLHLSEGCITVVSHFEFDRLQRYVRTRQPDLPVPGTTLRAYGTVEVR